MRSLSRFQSCRRGRSLSRLMLAAALMLVAAQQLVGAAARADARQLARALISEVGTSIYEHKTVTCQQMLSLFGGNGSAVCVDDKLPVQGNTDFPMGSPEISFPTDGAPWGVHISGPFSDGLSYLISWHSLGPHVNSTPALQAINATKCALAAEPAVQLSCSASATATFTGRTITYIRSYIGEFSDYSYLSPCLHHVVVTTAPGTSYTYKLRGNASAPWSDAYTFTSLPGSSTAGKFPLRVGIIGDVGQTRNTSVTFQQLLANAPDMVLSAGDQAYADVYSASNPDKLSGQHGMEGPSNQQRWDTWQAMTEGLWSSVPGLLAAGNHELETTGINAAINYTTYSFSYPDNYPFQAVNARWPAPAILDPSKFGEVSPYYFSSRVMGVMKVIVFNNYVPFYDGTPQHAWAMQEFASFNRTETPWLMVMLHSSMMHNYADMYKEGECFRSVWEDTFYQYGVDLVVAGHVHAYERTHPVYDYEVDTCGPIHLTIGDGGNGEGPVRQYVDEVIPFTNNMTFCEALVNVNNSGPNAAAALNQTWGHAFQFQAQPPWCPNLSWQPSYNVKQGPVLVPKAGSPSLGFCQSSQPLWSAQRDPSFGHAILEIQSPTVATFSWFRNQDGGDEAADYIVLERQAACTDSRRRRRLASHRRRRELRATLADLESRRRRVMA